MISNVVQDRSAMADSSPADAGAIQRTIEEEAVASIA
jgi:hypothetical protein